MVRDPGSKALYSVEQSDKSIALACMCCIAYMKKMANVVIVKHTVDGAEDVSRKIRDVVTAMRPVLGGGDVHYVKGRGKEWECLQHDVMKQGFECGRLTLVVAPTPQALQRLDAFLKTVRPGRLLVLGDEADELWSYHVTPERMQQHVHITQRERQLYELLTSNECLHAFIQVKSGCWMLCEWLWTWLCSGLRLGLGKGALSTFPCQASWDSSG